MTDHRSDFTLETRLRAVWSRSQRKHFCAGFLALSRWAIPLFLVGMLVDWLVDLPTAGRALILLAVIGVSLWKAWRNGWRQLRRFKATRTALEVEKVDGKMESLLVTALQLKEAGPTSGTSEALWKATQGQAEEVAKGLEPSKLIDFRSLRLPLWLVMFLVGVMVVFALLNGPFLAAGLSRIFNPWMAMVYPTQTQLDLGAGNLVVKEGDRAEISIGVSGDVPAKATLSLRTGEEGAREIEIEISEGRGEYVIASASRDFSYRVKAGDARSEWYEVKVIAAPRIESVKVDLEFPAYLERESETVEALTLTVPEETKVHWQLSLDQPIRDAFLIRDGTEPMPLSVTEGGRKLVIDEVVEASRGYRFSWVEEEHGFDFTSPRYFLQVASDQAPRVELTSPAANLNALLGRQLDLAVRARDDHGIGATAITYRVNLRPENIVTLAMPVENGDGEQVLDWDYREALPDLEVGDTVSFVVEVADKYPGPDGAQKARSETRRITFLSREEYLAQIERKKDRLLTRVRTIYRQERAAHELVRTLDPASESFRQTCQLEAIRQEMLREQLKDTADEFQALLDDLKANNVTDAAEGEVLLGVRQGLESIAEGQVAKAASLLREQVGGSSAPSDSTPAIEMVNEAARSLADLVQRRGIDSAREVFARESHMLAQEQATLRLLAMRPLDDEVRSALATRQDELGAWTKALIDSLREGMRYDKRPISVLGLSQRLKELAGSGVEEKMRQAASQIREGKSDQLAALHLEVITPLLEAEFRMRTGAEYAAVMKFRSELEALRKAHTELRASCESANAEEFGERRPGLIVIQSELQGLLIQALLPPVPAPRARLFDQIRPEVPPLGEVRAAAEKTMTEALARLEAGEQKSALEQQVETEKHLTELAGILDQSLVELGLRTQGLTSLVSTATERATRIEDFEARQIVLLEQTEEAALDEVKSEALAEPQNLLAKEIVDFRKELESDEKGDRDILPLLSRLDEIVEVLSDTASTLRKNKAEDALETQEIAADLLAEVLELAKGQMTRLSLLQDLYTFQRSVGNANGWMVDIVAEQSDLLAETKVAKAEDATRLIPVMRNLRQCFTDIAPVLDLVAGRLDAGTPLVFAGTDLEDAIFAIEDDDMLEAVDAQEVVVESLGKVQGLVAAVQIQTGYVAEIVEFLHSAQAEASSLAFRQKQLREEAAKVPGKLAGDVLVRQGELAKEAEGYGRRLQKASGMASYTMAGEQMAEAVGSAEPLASMELAEASLAANAEDLFLIMTMLHGLPAIEITSASAKELVVLLDTLSFASDQRDLSRETEVAKEAGLVELAARQEKIEQACAKVLELGSPHPVLISSRQLMEVAALVLRSSSQAIARLYQESVDETLRHFIIEQALILETAKAPGSSSDEPVLSEAETDDLYESTANFVSDFVSGEAPKDQRTEWEVLGNRNRAALNQNFARELPLEYRGILKNYYERVAK